VELSEGTLLGSSPLVPLLLLLLMVLLLCPVQLELLVLADAEAAKVSPDGSAGGGVGDGAADALLGEVPGQAVLRGPLVMLGPRAIAGLRTTKCMLCGTLMSNGCTASSKQMSQSVSIRCNSCTIRIIKLGWVHRLL